MTCQLTVMNLATTGSCRSDVKGMSCCQFLELVPAKGLPRCAAISPGPKGCWLRCPHSPGRSKQSDHTIPPLPGRECDILWALWPRTTLRL